MCLLNFGLEVLFFVLSFPFHSVGDKVVQRGNYKHCRGEYLILENQTRARQLYYLLF